MALSTHKVEVVPISLEKHPNADTLSIVRVWGYTCVVQTREWEGRSTGAYIPPDSVVPDRPEFAFLSGRRRIRVRKFRGVVSQGLLWPAPPGSRIGDDVAEALGVTHYEPPVSWRTGGEDEPAPVPMPKYDIDSAYRYKDEFIPGEEVIATEKIHGANAAYLWRDGRLWARSHTAWKKPDPGILWWQCVAQNPGIEEWCRANENLILCGEVFGQVQDLKYGAGKGKLFFRSFDVMGLDGRFLDQTETIRICKDLFVPIVYSGPFDFEKIVALSNGPSLIPGADNLREGIVVGTAKERAGANGRVKYKFVSTEYLERAK